MHVGKIDGSECGSLNLVKRKTTSVLDLATGKGMNVTICRCSSVQRVQMNTHIFVFILDGVIVKRKEKEKKKKNISKNEYVWESELCHENKEKGKKGYELW